MEEERMSRRRWGLGGGAAALSPSIFVIGKISEKQPKWLIVYLILYGFWGLDVGLFIVSVMERTPQFILRCFFYLCCIGMTSAFFNWLSRSNSDQTHLLLPICTTVGVFVGLGVSHCWTLIKKIYSDTCTNLCELLIRLLGSENGRRDSLPQYERRRQSSISSTSFTSSPSASTLNIYNSRLMRAEPQPLERWEENPWTAK